MTGLENADLDFISGTQFKGVPRCGVTARQEAPEVRGVGAEEASAPVAWALVAWALVAWAPVARALVAWAPVARAEGAAEVEGAEVEASAAGPSR